MSDLTPRELTRRYAAMFGWDLANGTGSIDRFTRSPAEELLASYRGPELFGEMVGLYNAYTEDGERVVRRRHKGDGERHDIQNSAMFWLSHSHDPAPRVPFVADSAGVVSR